MRGQLRIRDRYRALVAVGLGALGLLGGGAVAVVLLVGARDDPAAAAAPAAGAVGALALLVALVWWVAARRLRRRVVEPVETLASLTHQAATLRVPHALDAVRAGTEPVPVALPALPDGSEGEVVEIAASFEELQRRAVLLVSEQARLRRYVEETLVDLGRRNQSLLGPTLALIAELEANERDPRALDDLLRLDHLATRMRRNAESLLVLAGSEPPRTSSEPLEVADVVRAAVAEIEAYDRVDLEAVAPERIEGRAVAGVAHLLAELLENATVFSPPEARVSVLGRAEGDDYRITVVDRGVGMTPERLAEANERVSRATPLELVPARLLGLSVVGRLALRLGVRVRLLAGPEGGTVAEVDVPPELRSGAGQEAGLLPGSGGRPAAARPPAATTRPAARPAPAGEPGEASSPQEVTVGATGALPARVRGANLPDLAPARGVPVGRRRDADAVRSTLGGLQSGTERGRTVASGGLVRRIRGAHLPDAGPPRRLRRSSGAAAGEVAARLAAFQRGVARARGQEEPS